MSLHERFRRPGASKNKLTSPQDVYRARKQREELEKSVFMPPGLINNGNTCFMNSVLQGLISTRIIADLVFFQPVSYNSKPFISSKRSPQLTNGHDLAGAFKKPWVDAMPIGDTFITLLSTAWEAQSQKGLRALNPKNLLMVLSKKYTQFDDFAQQDAHEFLRILLDAMRVEEQDIIKDRQPQREQHSRKKKGKKKAEDDDYPLEEDMLMSFVDMVFGGQLTSILVCQKCKNISQTYEDFNDISLSIHPEDYTHGKRERLKEFAKRITGLHSVTPGHGAEILRPHSVPPPSPIEQKDTQPIAEEAETQRRLSLDESRHQNQENGNANLKDDAMMSESDGSHILDHLNNDKHIEGDKDKKHQQQQDEGWANFGRKLSLSVGLHKGGKQRFQDRRHRTNRYKEFDEEQPLFSVDTLSKLSEERPRTSNSSQPALSRTSARVVKEKGEQTHMATSDETYLRRILADTRSTAHSGPFGMFRQNGHEGNKTRDGGWLVDEVTGIEECLRLFTSVEVLDGENMLGCRSCWKLVHRNDDSASQDEEQEHCRELKPEMLSPAVIPKRSLSMSTPALTLYSSGQSEEAHSNISLPSSANTSNIHLRSVAQSRSTTSGSPDNMYGGPSIPIISTTEPDESSIVTFDTDNKKFAFSPPPNPSLAPQFTLHNSLPVPPHIFSSDSGYTTEEDTSVSCSASSFHSSMPTIITHPPSIRIDDAFQAEAIKPKSRTKPAKLAIMRPAYKRYLISIPPPVLVIHLKRFRQLSKTRFISLSHGIKKLEDMVTFPEYLDLAPYLAPHQESYGVRHGYRSETKSKEMIDVYKKKENEKCIYRLYAVVVHIGNMLGGHYIAYTAIPKTSPLASALPRCEAQSQAQPQNEENNESRPETTRLWAFISDTVVRLASIDEVLHSKAYMCMYEMM